MFEGTVEGLRASDTLTGRHLGYGAGLKPDTRKPAGPLESALAPGTMAGGSSSPACPWIWSPPAAPLTGRHLAAYVR